MDKVKKMILFSIPMSVCNLRCHYCYLAQREECYQGNQIKWIHSPEEYKAAFSRKRIGGAAYINLCADGETLLVKDLEKYLKVFLEEGHYVEIVTNCTISSMLDKYLQMDEKLLSHLEFKCSFHYLELKNRGLLYTFADNVKKIWRAGASANIEVTPSDELIPYIDEVKKFSIDNFGALPHLTIARDDRTKSIDYLTNLDIKTYDDIWSQFESDFWKYKRSIFGKKQTGFCYAGQWSMYCNIVTGDAIQCYCGKKLGNVFENIDKPLPAAPIGTCPLAHCYNGHMFLTLGLIPDEMSTNYGDIRDRYMNSGDNWLRKEYKDFVNTKLADSNDLLSEKDKKRYRVCTNIRKKLSNVKTILLRH